VNLDFDEARYREGAGPELATAVAAIIAMLVLSAPINAQSSQVGKIVGRLDGGRTEDGRFHIWGWACQQGRAESIDVHLYAQSPGATSETFMFAGKADLSNEPAVDQVCQDTQGHKHRFDVTVPNAMLADFHGRSIVVHGIRAAGTTENAAIVGSGTIQIPDALPLRTVPTSYPRVAGAYISGAEHPRVFINNDELQDLVLRIKTPGSFSAARFAALAAKVKSDLASNADWDEAYSGCDMEIYLRGFSYEPKPAYGNDRSDAELGAAMKIKPGTAPLHGGAPVASRMALYSALAKAGATSPAGAPDPDRAAAIAKRILRAWGVRGFRDDRGQFRGTESQYCDLDPTGKPVVTGFGTFVGALTLSRGVIYSVHAQDLLQSIHVLNDNEQQTLAAFHHQMYELIRKIHNQEYELNMKWKYSDEVYNNQFTAHLTALLSIARLFDDETRLQAALYGGAGDGAVALPWVRLFDVIYGPSDRPLLRISPNSSEDPLKSHPAFTTNVVAAGEINDRYRNQNPSQGIGYSMATLQGLFMAAEVLRIAGFDPYHYRGAHQQSLEMAVDYYACFAKHAGFAKVITAANSASCPDMRQYLGKIVNGVDANILIGAWRFPQDDAITELEDAARSSASIGPFSLDAIVFGKWRN
jgi:hypothetical protein